MDDVDLITETLRRVTADGFDPRAAPWEHKVCVMLHAAQGLVDNGGFAYFFACPFDGEPDMQDFPAVFEAVGAHASAQALREALLRAQAPEPDYTDLDAILWRDSDENHALLARYITAHAERYK